MENISDNDTNKKLRIPNDPKYNVYDIQRALGARPDIEEIIIINNGCVRNFQDILQNHDFAQLKRLTVVGGGKKNHSLETLAGLPPLPALEELDVSGNDALRELKDMPSLPNLKKLNISNTRINSLDDLPRLENLEELDLSYLAQDGVTPGLTKLDLKGLTKEKLPKLKRLILNSSQIEPAALRSLNLPELETLSIVETPVHSLSFPGLPKLKHLFFRNNGQMDLGNLSPLQGLETLSMAGHKEPLDLSKLPKLPNLKFLDISSAPEVTGFEGLKNLPALETLGAIGSPLFNTPELFQHFCKGEFGCQELHHIFFEPLYYPENTGPGVNHLNNFQTAIAKHDTFKNLGFINNSPARATQINPSANLANTASSEQGESPEAGQALS